MAVDNQRCWVGSLNIGSEYIYDGPLDKFPKSPNGIPGNNKWHDGLAVIESEELTRKINRVFACQWQCCGGDVFPTLPANEMTVEGDVTDSCAFMTCFPGNPVNPMASWVNHLMKWGTGEVFLANPYIIDKNFYKTFHEINDDEQYKKLKIITCLKVNDEFFTRDAIYSEMKGYLNRGVTLYDYSNCDRFSHWKFYLDSANNTFLHASFNLNGRSVLHDFESGVLVRSKKASEQARTLISYSIDVAKQMEDKEMGRDKVERLIDLGITELTQSFT